MSVSKSLARIAQLEEKARQQAHKEGFQWKSALEEKVPDKVLENLKSVFCKAFAVIFEKGTGIIEKTYRKEELEKDFRMRDLATDLDLNARDRMLAEASAELSGLVSLAVSTVEGVGLGALGIGLPDIVLFVSMILRGCYEMALRYGFSYDTPAERMFLLTLLEGSMARGESWDACSDAADGMMRSPAEPDKADLDAQIRRTAEAFATDMLLAKFVQSLPFVGMAGGLANPYYYRKILRYVRMKYRKRYLLEKQKAGEE